jgi:formate dehydrogenase gamma subunit
VLPSGDAASQTFRTNIPKMCGECHGVDFVVESSGLSTQPFFSYQKSVHGKAVATNSMAAAVCTDCHRSHDVHTAADANSPIFRLNIPQTCGHCHQQALKDFSESIHGAAIERGNSRAPVCTDCHGIHSIKSHIDKSSPVAQQLMAKSACGQCHEGVRLSEEFGVAGGRVGAYLDSYHGLASQLGSKVVANCASCHGVHKILPSSDPDSSINKHNLVQTCGQCHPGANENFTRGPVHLTETSTDDFGAKVNRWVRWIYIALIIVVIGFLSTHNALAWHKKFRDHLAAEGRLIVRMTLSQRIQHMLLFLSFAYLALTGFALKYPDSWMAWLCGSDETVRRLGHRFAGVFLLLLGAYHLVSLVATRSGRKLLKDMLLRLQDLKDLALNLKYYLGKSRDRARFGRFGYPEKLEYWAVGWGSVLMGITGFVIWYKVDVTRFLPRWFIEVATTIHFYEAILAILAILVWHLYHVIFDPDVYPMNAAWWDGKVPEKWYRHEHPLDQDSLKPPADSSSKNADDPDTPQI